MKKLKVAIGLSGGVDSAVSAALLVQAGYDVTGVYLECWRAPGCPTEQDRKDALDVALHLNIPFKVLDFKKRYHDKVVDYFYKEYQAGRTPNPDTMCNKEIKFGLFYDWAVSNGFDYVATGHYAQIKNGQLLRGVDPKKDQSYFLYQLEKDQLNHILFPVGHLIKAKVRSQAKKFKLPVANKPDSQGICFIGPVNIKKFLQERIKAKKGKVLIKNSKTPKLQNSKQIGNWKLEIDHSDDYSVIGQHDGAWYFTIGQRHGFKINSKLITPALPAGRQNPKPNNLPPLYVISKDVNNNTIVVGERKYLYSSEFSLDNVHWINPSDKEQVTHSTNSGHASYKNLSVRIRHQGELIKIDNIKPNDRIAKTYHLMLSKPAFAIAPGQAAVIYQKDQVLGGGIII